MRVNGCFATSPRFVRKSLHDFVAALVTQEGKDKDVATPTASADTSIFLRAIAELALPRGRNRHLVYSVVIRHCECFRLARLRRCAAGEASAKQSQALPLRLLHQPHTTRLPRNDVRPRVHALSFPDVLSLHLLYCFPDLYCTQLWFVIN